MKYTIECTGENATKTKMRYRVFNDLRAGDVFKFSKDLWLKLRAVDKYNTVNLSDGSLKWFGSNVEVEVYTEELTFSKALFSDKIVVEE